MATSLAVKYRPQTWDDVIGQGAIKITLEQQINEDSIAHALLFCGCSGCGKAQPLYSKVLTPNGYITMADVKVGTEVITDKGNIAKVSDIFPQGERDIYEITLQDKTKIRVADNHLNCVWRYNHDAKKREDFVINTLDLIKFIKSSRYKLRIDTPTVEFDYRKPLIDPYLLGILIGDGSLNRNFAISNVEHDILDKVNFILNRDYGMYLKGSYKDYHICYTTNPRHNGSRGDKGRHPLVRNYDVMATLRGQLDYFGLLCKSVDKHIPKEYLINSKDVRIALLQGLFDSDGFTSVDGCVHWTTSSKQLSDDFAFLVRSLGIRDTVTSKHCHYTKCGVRVECHDCYMHYLHTPNDFPYCSSKKHLDRYKNRQNPPLRNIVSIDYVGKEECQCIMIDHNDHTYISDDFIPTHNTTIGRIFANEINSNQGKPIELDAASNNSVDDIRSIIDQAKTKSLDSKYKVIILDEVHMLSTAAQNALLKILEEPPESVVFILCTTNPEKLLPTILSRVQRYDFKKISYDGIMSRLEYILQAECDEGAKYIWSDEALSYIAKMGDGGMRASISMMDKCLSYSPNLTVENVTYALGITGYEDMFKMLSYLANKNANGTIETINYVYMNGVDIKQWIKQFTNFVLDVEKFQITGNYLYIQIPSTYDLQLSSFSKVELHWVLDCLVSLNTDLKYDSTPKETVESKLLLAMWS